MTQTNRFEDFDIESDAFGWTISVWDLIHEHVVYACYSYWDLASFCQTYYNFNKSETVKHLNTCEEHETEKLLIELFKEKMK